MHRLITPTLILSFLLSSCAPALTGNAFSIVTHPDGALYIGDQISFEVIPPTDTNNNGGSIEVAFNGQKLASSPVTSYGIGGRNEATFYWVWDTRDLKPGRYSLTFTRLPENQSWSESFSLLPTVRVHAPEPGSHWVSSNTVCCTLHYISGTAAERDITTLSREVDHQSAAVATQMNITLTEPIDMVIMSRVIGQGGFTTSSIYISYLDGNYIGNDLPIVFHHELVHFYDGKLGGAYRPSIFVEGLAVYLSGGHFKPEPLGSRAAGLLDLGWYIPLTAIVDDFYNQQHEIAYLEAGSLIKYLVETYGWNSFNQFYRTIPEPKNQSVAAVLDSALNNSFGISFAELENRYLKYLHSLVVPRNELTDLQLTVTFFDTARQYQKVLDPSAYFLTAWLPDASTMRQRGIVADYLRHPEGLENRLFEPLLIVSQKELFGGDYKTAEISLSWTKLILDVVAPK